jgi:isopentenyl diphosphate isomerase/L-lactate dehydrogenase-like FMN-dependent dehydrogenase
LAILKDELIRTMSLCGTPSLSDIHAELLMPAGGLPDLARP